VTNRDDEVGLKSREKDRQRPEGGEAAGPENQRQSFSVKFDERTFANGGVRHRRGGRLFKSKRDTRGEKEN